MGKRAIYLESHEIETVAQALEGHACESTHRTDIPSVTGRRELKRIAKKFRDVLAPKLVTGTP